LGSGSRPSISVDADAEAASAKATPGFGGSLPGAVLPREEGPRVAARGPGGLRSFHCRMREGGPADKRGPRFWAGGLSEFKGPDAGGWSPHPGGRTRRVRSAFRVRRRFSVCVTGPQQLAICPRGHWSTAAVDCPALLRARPRNPTGGPQRGTL
jgi:hypothetical protein